MSEKLLPCPFCGGEAKQIHRNRVACKKCGMRTVDGDSFIKNKKKWNTRYKSTYETPQAYKQRTGKNYPDAGSVWCRMHIEDGWKLSTYKQANDGYHYIVIVPCPTKDWKPE